jgi:hypothetical protein
VVQPPGDQDMDIEPGVVSAGDALGATLTTNDQLPPQLFGTLARGKSLTLSNVEATVVNLTSISLYQQNADGSKDPNNYLTLTLGADSQLVWTRTGPSGTVTLSAYDPSQQNGNCYLMSANLATFIQSGNALSFTTTTDNKAQTGEFKAPSSDPDKLPRIEVAITLAAGNPCAPAS